MLAMMGLPGSRTTDQFNPADFIDFWKVAKQANLFRRNVLNHKIYFRTSNVLSTWPS